jgi:hypothetical protein
MEKSQIERTEYTYCGQSPSGSLDEEKERKEEAGRLKKVCLVSKLEDYEMMHLV